MHYWVDIQKSRLSEIMNDGLLMWKKFTHWKVTWHKRWMSTSPCTKYSSYWSYWVAFFLYAWGYIDFSLWLSFPQTQEEEKQLQTDAGKAQMPPPKTGSKNRHTWQDGSRRGHAAEIGEAGGVTWTCWAKSSSFQPARLPKGGHLFLVLRVFLIF